jgi:alkanesulfonate monooxygenase SsuD/methylene tetrahydromethanopterin reductase-like flavin-dependent oxidoreductase (luciferase family)
VVAATAPASGIAKSVDESVAYPRAEFRSRPRRFTVDGIEATLVTGDLAGSGFAGTGHAIVYWTIGDTFHQASVHFDDKARVAEMIARGLSAQMADCGPSVPSGRREVAWPALSSIPGVLVAPDAPFEVLADRWRAVEELGFDQLWLADHSGDYRDRAGQWFDGWTALAHATLHTRRMRIGTLVSNPILRSPALLARQALAIDHLSQGRLELGIGMGIAEFDHRAMGVGVWDAPERAARFAEYVDVVDGLLRSGDPALPFRFAGRYYQSDHHALVPSPVQSPRPPITLGGQSPTVLRAAARLADRWNTHGPFGASADEILIRTREQNDRLDDLCRREGRQPAELRRALLCYAALDPWRASDPRAGVDALAGTVERFIEAGVQEFVVFWPPEDDISLLELAATAIGGR